MLNALYRSNLPKDEIYFSHRSHKIGWLWRFVIIVLMVGLYFVSGWFTYDLFTEFVPTLLADSSTEIVRYRFLAVAFETCKALFLSSGTTMIKKKIKGGVFVFSMGVVLMIFSVIASMGSIYITSTHADSIALHQSDDYTNKKDEIQRLKNQVDGLQKKFDGQIAVSQFKLSESTSRQLEETQARLNEANLDLSSLKSPGAGGSAFFKGLSMLFAMINFNWQPDHIKVVAQLITAVMVEFLAIALNFLGSISIDIKFEEHYIDSRKTPKNDPKGTPADDSVPPSPTVLDDVQNEKKSNGPVLQKSPSFSVLSEAANESISTVDEQISTPEIRAVGDGLEHSPTIEKSTASVVDFPTGKIHINNSINPERINIYRRVPSPSIFDNYDYKNAVKPTVLNPVFTAPISVPVSITPSIPQPVLTVPEQVQTCVPEQVQQSVLVSVPVAEELTRKKRVQERVKKAKMARKKGSADTGLEHGANNRFENIVVPAIKERRLKRPSIREIKAHFKCSQSTAEAYQAGLVEMDLILWSEEKKSYIFKE